MPLEVENPPGAIRSVKENLRKALPSYSQVFHEVETEMHRKVPHVVKEREAGEPVVSMVKEEIDGRYIAGYPVWNDESPEVVRWRRRIDGRST